MAALFHHGGYHAFGAGMKFYDRSRRRARARPKQGCAPEFIPETHTRQKYPTFVKWTGITRTPDTHLSWVGYIPIPKIDPSH